jgi:hypothetical protein
VAVGALGIQNGATITTDQRKALGVATGLIAIAVRNVQLFLETREYSLRGDDLPRAVGAQFTRMLRSADLRCRSRSRFTVESLAGSVESALSQ